MASRRRVRALGQCCRVRKTSRLLFRGCRGQVAWVRPLFARHACNDARWNERLRNVSQWLTRHRDASEKSQLGLSDIATTKCLVVHRQLALNRAQRLCFRLSAFHMRVPASAGWAAAARGEALSVDRPQSCITLPRAARRAHAGAAMETNGKGRTSLEGKWHAQRKRIHPEGRSMTVNDNVVRRSETNQAPTDPGDPFRLCRG